MNLAEKGILINDKIDKNLGGLNTNFDELLTKIAGANENASEKAIQGINFVQETLNKSSEIAQDTIELAKQIPDTNTYKQLGDLPDRAKLIYQNIKTEATALSETAQTAREKLLSGGDIEEALQEFLAYYNAVDAF